MTTAFLYQLLWAVGKTPIKYFQILIAGEVILSLKLKLLQGPGRYINGEEAGPGSNGEVSLHVQLSESLLLQGSPWT